MPTRQCCTGNKTLINLRKQLQSWTFSSENINDNDGKFPFPHDCLLIALGKEGLCASSLNSAERLCAISTDKVATVWHSTMSNMHNSDSEVKQLSLISSQSVIRQTGTHVTRNVEDRAKSNYNLIWPIVALWAPTSSLRPFGPPWCMYPWCMYVWSSILMHDAWCVEWFMHLWCETFR